MLDHSPRSGLSPRGLLTVALAAVVAILLTFQRRHGPGPAGPGGGRVHGRSPVAGLLAATVVAVDQPRTTRLSGQTRTQAAASDDLPAVIRA